MSKFGDVFKKRLNAIRTPKYNHDNNFTNFVSNYGWVFLNSNRIEGDYGLYELAKKNVYVNRCIEVIAEGLISNGFSISNPDSTDENKENVEYLTNVFNRPHGYGSDMTYNLFHYQYITSFKLTGDAFIEVDYNQSNIIEGFQFIPPALLKYYEDTDQWGYRNKPNLRYEPDELIHIYKPGIDFEDMYYGESVLDQLQIPIQMMFSGLTHNKKLLENDGLDPKAVLSFDKEMDDTSFQHELERLELIKKNGMGGGTLAIKGGSFQSSSRTNEDMHFLELMKLARNMIITAYGLQPAKLGIIETASLGSGTGESQDKMFKDTIDANARIIENAFNNVLGRNGFSEIFSFERLDIEDKLVRSQIEANKLSNGVVTINEVRAGYGLPPVSWGDTPNIPK